MEKKAVFWDLDGTLIDSEPLHCFALFEAVKSFGYEAPPDLHKTVIGRSGAEVYNIIKKKCGIQVDFNTWIRTKYRHYMANNDRLKPRPGSMEIYHNLSERGIDQALVSNSDRIIVEENIRVLSIKSPGLRSISRNDIRNGKPDPEGYLRAAWLHMVEAKNAIVIEDSVIGARAGLAAGMNTLFWPEVQPDLGKDGQATAQHALEIEWLDNNGLKGAHLAKDASDLMNRINAILVQS